MIRVDVATEKEYDCEGIYQGFLRVECLVARVTSFLGNPYPEKIHRKIGNFIWSCDCHLADFDILILLPLIFWLGEMPTQSKTYKKKTYI